MPAVCAACRSRPAAVAVLLYLLAITSCGADAAMWTLQTGERLALLEAESMPGPHPAEPGAASGGKAIVLDRRNDGPAVQAFTVTGADRAEIWARIRFEHGGANSFFVALDKGKRRTISSNVFGQWSWIRIAAGIAPGSHDLSITPRETSRLDCLALYRGDDFTREPIYSRVYPARLPLGIPNDLTLEEAPRSGIWSVFGTGAGATRAGLDGPDLDGRGYANRLVSKHAGELYLMLRNPRSVALHGSLLPRELPQQLILPYQTLTPVGIDAVFEVAAGEHRRVSGGQAQGKGWLAFDLLEPAGTKPLTVPLKLVGLVLSAGKTGTDFSWGHPTFVTTAKLNAHVVSRAGNRVDIRVRTERLVAGPGSLRVLLRIVDPDDQGNQIGKPEVVDIVLGESATVPIMLPPKKSVFHCLVSAGMAAPQRLMVAGSGMSSDELLRLRRAWARRLGAYEFPKAEPFLGRREDVANDYGKRYHVVVEGLDIAGRKHADRLDLPRLIVEGTDLSDETGWPDIYVEPGVLAVDPETRRIKVHPKEDRPLAFLGLGLSGFGVPGSGRVLVSKGFCYIPGGEGDTKIIDVRNPAAPRQAAIIETYYFYHGFHRLGDSLFFNASRGVGLVSISDISDPFHPGKMSVVSGIKEKIIGVLPDETHGVFSSAEGIRVAKHVGGAVPFQFVGRPIKGHGILHGSRLWVTETTGTGPNTKCALRLYSLDDPLKPGLMGAIPVKEVSEADKVAFERLQTCGDDWAITIGGNNLTVYQKTKDGIKEWCIANISEGVPPPVVVRDTALLADRWLIVLDGRQQGSQHGLDSRDPPSRIIVYDLTTAEEQDALDVFLEDIDVADEIPQEESLPGILRKPVAVYTDEQPSEYANLTMDGTLAYINDYDYGLVIFDMKNPRKPRKLSKLVGCGEGRIGGYVGGGLAFVGQTFGGSIIASDISDPANPCVVGNYWDGAWNHYWSRFAGRGRILYAARPYSVKIIDFTEPAKPVVRGTFNDIDGKPLEHANPYVWDSTCCVAAYYPGECRYVFYDVADAARPRLIGRLVIEGPAGDIVQMAHKNGRLVSVDGKRLRLLDVRDPAKPKLLGEITEEEMKQVDSRAKLAVYQASAENVCLAGHFAYTSFCDEEVTKTAILQFDLSDPADPKFVKLFDPQPKPMYTSWPDFYGDYITYGNYMVGGNYGQIELFDISVPSSPEHIATRSRGYQWSCGTVYKGILYAPSLGGIATYRLPVPDMLFGEPKVTGVGRVPKPVSEGN